MTGTFPPSSGISTALTTLSSSSGITSSKNTKSAASGPSSITLSDGLGPLLSSSTSKTSSTPATSTDETTPTTPTDTGDSIIAVLSDTLTPTAVSSDLSTSGVPQPLSVDLSSATEIPALDSSTALISFGTSSPAVLSTVLPPGASLGTSSQTLTTYPTIALGSASLTGVTLLAPRSPTSCFNLPTPAASLDLIAVAVVPQNDFDLSNPVFLAFGDNGTTPQYISAMASGNPYVLNLSPDSEITGQLGLQIPGEDALVFDGSGMSLYTGNCSTLTQVLVDNFYSQLGTMAGRSSRGVTSKGYEKRQASASSTFTVEVAVDSYLNTGSFSPNLTFGNSQCTLQSSNEGSDTNNITWACLYPPPTGGVAACESNLDSWLNDMTAPSATPGNTTEVLATISPFLALAGDSILDLFPGSDPALALGFTFMRQAELAAKQAVGHVGPAACQVMHAFDSDDLVVEDSGPLGTQTVGSYMTAPPPSLAINLAASATAAIVNIPRRKVNPTDNFLKQIATDFKNIFGAFTHWLGGLIGHGATGTAALSIPSLSVPALSVPALSVPALSVPGIPGLSVPGVPGLGVPGIGGLGGGGGGLVETGALPLANPDVTITATSTGIPSEFHIAIPTVTVTHVLGNGWFTPSTYVVGSDTSVAPQFPAKEPYEAGTVALSASTASFSLEEYQFLSSSSSATFAHSSLVNDVVAQLASIEMADAIEPGTMTSGTTTAGAAHGYSGHVVVVTTTLTFLASNSPE